MKEIRKLAFEEGTKLQRELQRTEKDIEFVVQDTLNPLFLRILANPDESASPWRWVRRLLPLVAMGVGVGLQPGSLVIFSGAAALDPPSAIIFLGLLSVSAMTVSRWPYLFLIAVPWPWLGSRQPCSLFLRAKEN